MEKGVNVSKKPPMIPVVVLIYCNFAFLFNFVLLETLSSTLAMDQWGWSPVVSYKATGLCHSEEILKHIMTIKLLCYHLDFFLCILEQ